MSYPGSDTRLWLSKGVVKELGFDAAEGVFADVTLLPCGTDVTCYVAAPYAGTDFGAWFPLKVDDTVLVAMPRGDANEGPVIVCRFWNAGDPPPADAGNASEPVEDVVVRVEAGKNCKIVVSGAGNVQVIAEGSGNIELVPSAGKVLAGASSETRPLTFAEEVANALCTLILQLQATAAAGGAPAAPLGTLATNLIGAGWPATLATVLQSAVYTSLATTKVEGK